jgi:hypothetical protein
MARLDEDTHERKTRPGSARSSLDVFWDMQRALLMGEDEETTGVVKFELPEL